jgi:hypothetical protein
MSEEEDESQGGQGFKIKDRRRFSETGERRDAAEDAEDAEDVKSTPESAPQAPRAATGDEDPDESAGANDSYGDINFSSFAVGLATQALMFMGLAPDPASGLVHRDLSQAKTLIDILGMLADKTRGNLDEEEATMMEEMLYELRMQYVRVLRSDDETPQSGGTAR